IIDATIPELRRDALAVRNGTASLVVQNYRQAPSISGSIRAGEIVQGANTLRDTDLVLESTGNRTGFTVTSRFNGGPASIRGALTTGQALEVALDAASLTFQNIPIALRRSTQVNIENGTTRIAETTLEIGGGSVVVSGTAGDQLNISARINSVPASIINQFARGLGAQGTVNGTVGVAGAASDPSVSYDVNWTGASLAQTQSLGVSAMSLTARGRYANGQVNFESFGAQNGQGLSLSGSGTVGVANGGGLGLTITGQTPFALLAGMLAEQGIALTGSADVNLRVGGTTGNPDISGTVRSNGGRLVLAASGLAINNIALNVDLGANTARITALAGQLSSGGSVSGSGTIGIAQGSGYPADLRLLVENARYTDGRLVTTNLGGEITLSGQLTASPDIGGTINLGRTVVTIPERLPASLTRLNVQHRNAPADVRRQRQALTPITSGGNSGSGIGLNITVNAPQQIFVRGRGLDAELGGNIVLTGNTAAPEAQGQFELRRGRLEILGRRLTFTEGTMTFAGSYIPYLDMRAESKATDTTVTVLVTGPADNPKFSFESIPALPEDEVLARLIFGREMSSLSPVQIARLAAAAAELAGVGGSSSLLSTLEDSIGVDDIDVESTEDGGTSVRAGKYLNERTYVTIEKGDAAGSGKATINLDLGRGLKVRGQASDDGDAGGGIFYEREY
ncbi:translocation/assembly module TamB domain-containing protein, partial [Limoniibacter endophyticus]